MKASVQQYAKTLLEITENKSEKEISGIAVRFIETLNKNGQFKESEKIIEKFSELYNAKHGIVEAEIITRYKIQDTRYKQIEDFLKAKYKAKEVVIKNVVDEKIKGGIIIKIGDEVLDGSIKFQLNRLEKALMK